MLPLLLLVMGRDRSSVASQGSPFTDNKKSFVFLNPQTINKNQEDTLKHFCQKKRDVLTFTSRGVRVFYQSCNFALLPCLSLSTGKKNVLGPLERVGEL